MPVLLEMPRYYSIVFSRLKFNCSGLNDDLFNCNLLPSPDCACRTGAENLFHYLYDCPYYDLPRLKLMNDLDSLGLYDLSIGVLFNLNEQMPVELVFKIQRCLYAYIASTQRF